MSKAVSVLAICFALQFYALAAAVAQRVDLNLVVAVDCSWSVNEAEFKLQQGGLATAFSDPAVIEAIKSNPRGAISVSVIHWSTEKTQINVLKWTKIDSTQSALTFANQILETRRATAKGGTSISGALQASQSLLETAPFRADRHVIDIIADGENNTGRRVERARDDVILRGTVINALAVINEVSYLHHYLHNRVIGGPGAFVERADEYQDFARAFRKKLLREIKGQQFSQKGPERS